MQGTNSTILGHMSRHILIVVFLTNLVYTVIQSALIAIIDYNFIVVLIYFICVLPQCVCVTPIYVI